MAAARAGPVRPRRGSTLQLSRRDRLGVCHEPDCACSCTRRVCYLAVQLYGTVGVSHGITRRLGRLRQIACDEHAASCRLGRRCRLWTRMCRTRQALCSGRRTTRGQPSTARPRRRPAACLVSLLWSLRPRQLTSINLTNPPKPCWRLHHWLEEIVTGSAHGLPVKSGHAWATAAATVSEPLRVR